MVFYRKYRPKTLDELDLSSVREKLTSLLSSKGIPHALLFTGPKGLGKTSAARIIASEVNRPTEKTKEKEYEETRKRILDGSHIDVLEIDAASNRGIDEIRLLRERVKYAPSELSKKVYIIDEVHMLTTEAFNALLKTLEEPPEHVVFILATTELHKVPQTIISRSFHTEFKKPTQTESIRSLQRIVEGEKLKIEDGVLEEIYKLSEGSFRDAAKILEELTFISGNKIGVDAVKKYIGYSPSDREIGSVITHLSRKNLEKSLEWLEKSSDALGSDSKNYLLFIESLVSSLREILLKLSGISNNEKETYGWDKSDISKVSELIELLTEAYRQTKYSPIPSLPLELVFFKWCVNQENRTDQSDPSPIVKDSKKNENEDDPKLPIIKTELKHDKKKELTEDDEKKLSESKKHGDLFDTSLSENFYQALISEVKQDNHSIAGVLRSCKLVEISDDGKVIFSAPFQFHQERLNSPKTREIIENRASKILNRKVTLVVQKN